MTAADELQVPIADARKRLGIDGMRAALASGIRDTSRMREKLAAAGLPIARFTRIESVEDALAFGTDIGYFPLIVKPNVGATPRTPTV
jgi:biotin carboxylase